jgi:uncharacterized protein (TIGR03437 family)
MIRRIVQAVKNNKFSAMLWLGIAVLLFSSYQKGSSQGPNQPGIGRPSPLGSITFGSGPTPCKGEEQVIFGMTIVACAGAAGSSARGASDLRFEWNVGQADSSYNFVAHGRAQSILLSSAEAAFQLKGPKQFKARTMKASLQGGRIGVEPKTEQPLSGHVNYLIGNDPQKWHTDIPTFGRVRFPDVYQGIDVVYYGHGGELETDFEIQPGADPEAIRIRFDGSDQVRLESDGSLSALVDTRTLSWKKPVLYQAGSHGFTAVEGRFKMASDGAVGFEVGVYDNTRPLVIDPVLTYSTYFGTPAADFAARVVADASGSAYVVGGSDDQGFPVTPGAFFDANSGQQGTVAVAKLSATGSMVYETHIGGSNGELGFGIAIDPSGDAYVVGTTDSTDFPLLPASNNHTTNAATDPLNCFVTKLNPAGNGLVYSMVIGGSNTDGCSSIALDASGNAYVTGVTNSTDLPTVNAIQSSLPPSQQFGSATAAAFIFKLNPAGTTLLYSTYFGGPGDNAATSIAVDSTGNAYFTGFTTSTTFPVTSNAFQTTYGGTGGQTYSFFTTGDAFVAKLTPTGQKVYATYLGGLKDDIGVSITIDVEGDAYVAGATLSPNFPTQNAFQATYHGAGGDTYTVGGDGFVTELNPTGTQILFSSYIGGSSDDRVAGIALDSGGNIYLAGHTISSDFPTAGQQAQPGYAGDNSTAFHTGDAFLAEISPAHILTLSTYFGGSGGDWAGGVAVDGQGGIIIVGGTSSTNLPVTKGAYQANYAGIDSIFAGVPAGDAFIARFGGAVSAVSISGVSNAASYGSGSIAPGEALYIAGTGIGPTTLAGAALTAAGSVSTQVAGTQFMFNGVAAPIVYVSATQSSVIVPYEVSTATSAQIVAVVNGVQSPPFTVPVAASLPGIFSANSSGTGQGAIFNQNLTYNSSTNPAARGTTVVLFLTGEGQTSPPGVDGQVTANTITPALPVTVNFGTVPATSYQFIGEAPGLVAGVLQINVTVPQVSTTGNVPITVTIGTATSQSGLTVAVQ